MKPLKPFPTIALLLWLFAATASAHTGDHSATGFVDGMAHPLLGLDHLLAMLAMGLWAAQQGGRARWALPAAFVAAMLAGGGLAAWGWTLPQVGTAIALSVAALGLLIATRYHASLLVGITLVSVFALFHGYAHGLVLAQAASPALYALGLVLATLGLQGVGIASSLIGRHAMRLAGMSLAATGLALIFGG